MRHLLAGTAILAAALTLGGGAEARGCIKGALVSGLAGHAAHHTLAGAAAGCAIGHHYANRRVQAPAPGPQPVSR